MIKVNNITKSIDGTPILNGVNMHIQRGSIYGLVGPNGAGKSTIIRTIVGAYKYDDGEILMDNRPIYEQPEVKCRIAYVPDDIFYHMGDNIRGLMNFYKGLYPTFDQQLFGYLMSQFPALNVKRNIRSFSKGMQRQTAVLLALCIRPELMLLDEPLDGLDPVIRRQVLSLVLDDVAQRKTTVLISSHNLRELEDICDHVGVMDKGKIAIEKPLSDLQSSVTKVQVVFDGDMPQLIEGVEILHRVSSGKVHTLILRGETELAEERLRALNPILLDILPLTLEEIFIYEMGGADNGTTGISHLEV